jgi:prophage tail gpP-like protein
VQRSEELSARPAVTGFDLGLARRPQARLPSLVRATTTIHRTAICH